MGLFNLLATPVPPLAAVSLGQYLNAWFALPAIVLLLIWARLLTWVDKDSEDARLPRAILNLGFLGGLAGAYLLFFIVPGFLLGLGVLLLVMGIETGIYLSLRQRSVGLGDLKEKFIDWLRSLRGKPQAVREVAGSVQIIGSDGALLAAPEADDPEAEAYTAVQTMLTAPLENNAQIIEVSPSETGITVKYSVDGVAYTGATLSKALGAAATSYLKDAAGLDMAELRKPQTGTLKVNINKQRRDLQLTTRGSTAGEYARFLADPKKRHSFTIETLGMFEDQIAAIRKHNTEGGGITLLSAPKGQGLTSLAYAMLRSHDAFLQHIITVERDQEQDLEGITQNSIAPNATAAEELKQVSWVLSQQPDVFLVSKPTSAQSVAEMVKAAKEGRRVYVTLEAPNTLETITAWRKMVNDDKLAMAQVTMVISGRTLRKLCVACKQGYTPDPETLRKLNMDPTKIEQLYQAPKQSPVDQKGVPIPCEFCNDLRYKNRSGIYEILYVDDDVRQAILSGATSSQLKTIFRKQRGLYLQELGLVLVEKGETSVQEVLRILRTDSGSTGGSSRKKVKA